MFDELIKYQRTSILTKYLLNQNFDSLETNQTILCYETTLDVHFPVVPLSCPEDMLLSLEEGSDTLVVQYTTPNDDTVCTPASGTALTVGQSEVTCERGNDQCAFSVIVQGRNK